MREAYLQGIVISRLRKEFGSDIWFEKISDRFKRGVPDILGGYRGRFFAMELKRPRGGRVAVVQSVTLGEIRDAGGLAFVIRGAEDIDAAIGVLRQSAR